MQNTCNHKLAGEYHGWFCTTDRLLSVISNAISKAVVQLREGSIDLRNNRVFLQHNIEDFVETFDTDSGFLTTFLIKASDFPAEVPSRSNRSRIRP